MTTKKTKKTTAKSATLRAHSSGRLALYLGRSPTGVEWWVYPEAGDSLADLERRVKVQRAGLAALHRAHEAARLELAKPKRKVRR